MLQERAGGASDTDLPIQDETHILILTCQRHVPTDNIYHSYIFPDTLQPHNF